MKIIDKNIADQTRGIFRKEGGGSEWRDIPLEEGSAQVLSDDEILELSELVVKIEQHYGFPCDIEWAREGGKFYIVQSRPITTLTAWKKPNVEEDDESDDASAQKNSRPRLLIDLSQVQGGKKTQKSPEVERDQDTCTDVTVEPHTMTLFQTREHSLLYCEVWATANHEHLSDLVHDSNLKRLVLLRHPGKNLIDIYFDLDELDAFDAAFLRAQADDPKTMERIEHAYWDAWGRLEPVVQGATPLSTAYDFEAYYRAWIDWWVPMAFSFVIPKIEGIPNDIAKRAITLREHSDKYSDAIDITYVQQFERVFPEHKSLAYLVTIDELLALCDDKLSEEERTNIGSRVNGCAIVNGSLVAHDEMENTLSEEHLNLERPGEPEVFNGTLTGTTAHKGVARGSVRIIQEKACIGDIEDGEVLVTHMTGPQFLPAMKKAAAIVTDEGGVTCHAAIVSRELKKPCVIGTKIATQVLKDGDMVEVDAERGVVTIIEKAAESGAAIDQPQDEEVSPENAVLFYASQGYGFLLEHMIVNSYVDWDVTLIGTPPDRRDYVTEDTLESLHQYGRTLTIDAINKATERVAACARELQTTSLEYDQVLSWFTTSDELFAAYRLFDTTFSEGIYAQDPSDARLEIIERSKNVLRDRMDALYFGSESALRNVLGCIEKHTHVQAASLLWYTRAEIDQLVTAQKQVADSVIEARRQQYVFRRIDGVVQVMQGDAARHIVEQYSQQATATMPVHVLQGTVAYHGARAIRGTVHMMLRDHADTEAFMKSVRTLPQDAILVTTTTDPVFVPAMKRAACVITELGGMLSHAAITCRELKKPCIVGVQKATQVLHDGDLVEVDAEKGEVRILERSEDTTQNHPITTLTTNQTDTDARIDLREYTKMFQLGAVPYFVNDLLLQTYKYYDVLFTSNGTLWESYMTSSNVREAEQEGVRFYSDIARVRDWVYEYSNYWTTAEPLLRQLLARTSLSEVDTQQFVHTIARFHSFYIRTEFFFTDSVYEHCAHGDTSLCESVEIITHIKQTWREQLTSLYFGEQSYIARFVRTIAGQTGIDKDLLWQYSVEELYSLVRGHTRPSSQELKARQLGYVVRTGGEGLWLVGKPALQALEQATRGEVEPASDATDSLTIRGRGAYAGTARGRVRVFYEGYGSNQRDRETFLAEFQPGDVLVVDTSSPRLEVVCGKASAIVADQGGTLSHAAIVARELKKPCVVGTKIATQVLKDGDLVEVDAEKGVVRVLERTESET